tara:strand:+ start:111 stop:344 length:234 start_codon:yes stop_codon:yes gene_type:complete
MSLLPVVRWSTAKNIVGLFTRRNIIKDSSVFNLNNTDLITSMRLAQNPTCRIVDREVVALRNLNPGDELTIKKPYKM